MARVFFYDMHPVTGLGLETLARGEPELEVVGHAHTLATAEAAVAETRPGVMVLDEAIRRAGTDHWLARLQEAAAKPTLVIFTALQHDAVILQALRLDALSIILKTEQAAMLFDAIRRAARGVRTFSPSVQNRLVFTEEGVELHRPFSARVASLSRRELVVVHELARGLSVKEVAALLCISDKTVDNHKTRAMAKLGVRNRAGLVRACFEEGIIVVPQPQPPT